MGDKKAGEPFGLDEAVLKNVDWKLALARVAHDYRSDFIYAPHLSFLYSKCKDELVNYIRANLSDGTYSPGLPLTIEVPKSFRIRVSSTVKRLGPNYSRPGSILMPLDRLFYQAIADNAAPIIVAKSNAERSFSHGLADAQSVNMFLPTRVCWSALQAKLHELSAIEAYKYVLKLDVANYFGSINQHTLINEIHDAGVPKSIHSCLEAILTAFAGHRSSRGILQGMLPSDLFGNNYLNAIDRFLEENDYASARYVDDIYIFVGSVEEADFALRKIVAELRVYDLVINEAKAIIIPKNALLTEEPDLEKLFDDAVEEIAAQLQDEDFDADYGFQAEWDDDGETKEGEEEESSLDIELQATRMLFDSIDDYPGQEENIERFCLPLFLKANSDYAVTHVINSFRSRPSMSQIYCSYLTHFLDDKKVVKALELYLNEASFFDWQKMWIIASLMQAAGASADAVKTAFLLFKDTSRHEALRSIAAIFVGKFGDHYRRKALVNEFVSVQTYTQLAIYFSSRYWPGPERANAKASWSNLTKMHQLMAAALAKK